MSHRFGLGPKLTLSPYWLASDVSPRLTPRSRKRSFEQFGNALEGGSTEEDLRDSDGDVDEYEYEFDKSLGRMDDKVLFGYIKNYLCHRLSWKGTEMIEACVQDALGIDPSHPEFEAICKNGSRNRDTWQGRILDCAHQVAVSFLETTEGRAIKNEYRGYVTNSPTVFPTSPHPLATGSVRSLRVAFFWRRTCLHCLPIQYTMYVPC